MMWIVSHLLQAKKIVEKFDVADQRKTHAIEGGFDLIRAEQSSSSSSSSSFERIITATEGNNTSTNSGVTQAKWPA